MQGHLSQQIRTEAIRNWSALWWTKVKAWVWGKFWEGNEICSTARQAIQAVGDIQWGGRGCHVRVDQRKPPPGKITAIQGMFCPPEIIFMMGPEECVLPDISCQASSSKFPDHYASQCRRDNSSKKLGSLQWHCLFHVAEGGKGHTFCTEHTLWCRQLLTLWGICCWLMQRHTKQSKKCQVGQHAVESEVCRQFVTWLKPWKLCLISASPRTEDPWELCFQDCGLCIGLSMFES